MSADRDRLAQIRAEHERTTHPDWRDATTVGVLLTELDRAEAETADLWEALAERRAVAQKLAEHADEVTAERDAAVAEAAALRNKLAAVEALHRPVDSGADPLCEVCSDHGDIAWPCATLRALDPTDSPARSCCGHAESEHHAVVDGKAVFCAACQNTAWHPHRAAPVRPHECGNCEGIDPASCINYPRSN